MQNKVPITTAADDGHKYIFIVFPEEISLMFQVTPLLEVNPAKQRILMKNQALFSFKDKGKKLKCCLVQLFGT